MGALPHANGGRVLHRRSTCPIRRPTRVPVAPPATTRAESTRALGELLRDVYVAQRATRNFRLFCPDETNSNRLGAVFEVENRCCATRGPPTSTSRRTGA